MVAQNMFYPQLFVINRALGRYASGVLYVIINLEPWTSERLQFILDGWFL